ncbi:MAG: HAD hydrolase-like protein, partial [Mycobacterium sp.]
RLDTDIAGANAAGLPSLMVLTGVSSARDAVEAVAKQRPTYIARDLRSLHDDAGLLAVTAQPDWQVHISSAAVTVDSGRLGADGDGLSIVRAVARAVWDADFDGRSFTVHPGDDTARDALQHWSLLTDAVD